MITNTYKIADKVVCFTTLYNETHSLCRDYQAPDAVPQLFVQTTSEDIAFECQKAARERKLEGLPPKDESDAYLETLAVYRQLAEQMPFYDTVLVHGSCIAVDGAAYLFTAKSGTGKSTHTRLWRELLPGRAVMVNDDKPLVRITEKGITVFGTPWDGKHRLSKNIAVPLKAICVLERGEENSIQRIKKEEAYPTLLQQIYRPKDMEALGKTLTLLDRLSESVSLWHLYCNISPEAALIAYQAMKK